MSRWVFLSALFLSQILGLNRAMAQVQSDCLKFVGNYSTVLGVQHTFKVDGIKIEFDQETFTLQLMYNSDTPKRQWPGWEELYVADGQKHPGDENTGKAYITSCTGDHIRIQRDGILKTPMITTLTLKGDELSLVEFFEGSKIEATHAKLRRKK